MLRKKIGLVLGGGGARGFAHIGVLKWIEENKIPIDYVAGTSIGAVIGALHCLGYTAEEIENLAKKTEFKKLFDFTLSRKGLIKGEKIKNYLNQIFKGKKFSDLKKPLFVVAADIKNLEEVIFNRGDLVKAVQASISIPGIFIPVQNKERILVDGGILNNLPIKTLESKNPDYIIAVNLAGVKTLQKTYETAVTEEDTSKISNLVKTFLGVYNLINLTLLEKNMINSERILVISPNLEGIKISSFEKIDEGIKEGYSSAKENSKKIKFFVRKEGFFELVKRFFNKSKL